MFSREELIFMAYLDDMYYRGFGLNLALSDYPSFQRTMLLELTR
jgi:hypothetical protein